MTSNITWTPDVSSDSVAVLQSPTTSSTSCRAVDLSADTTLDGSEGPISRLTADLFTKVKEGVIVPVFFFMGCPSNVLNMAVFYRQGLRKRINLCLFTLALTNLVFTAFVFLKYVDSLRADLFLGTASSSSTERNLGAVAEWFARYRLYGFYGFAWASMFVSAMIATERCLCVAWPLHSQNLMRTRTTALVLGLGVAVIVGAQFYVLGQFELVCLLDASTSKRYLQRRRKYFGSQAVIDFLDSVVYGAVLPLACVLVVVVVTAVTAWKLALTADFRFRSSTHMVPREVALTKMLILLSVQFVVLNLPIGILRAVKLVHTDLDFVGPHGNTYEVVSGLFEIFLVVYCSTNFVVYVAAGSKYRSTVRDMFRGMSVKMLSMMAATYSENSSAHLRQ